MNTRFFVRITAPVVTALLLTACGSPQNDGTGAVATDEPLSLTVAGTTFPGTEGEKHWKAFEAAILEGSGNSADAQIAPKMLIYGQLGSEEQIIAGLRRGRVQFANLSAMAVSALVPETALLYAPFLFDNDAEADYIFDEHLTGIYRELLAEQGLHLLSWYEIGFLQIYGKAPLLAPGDLEGRRFRVGAGLSAREFGKALKADVIPLGFADVVSSLQTGLIESGENSVSLYARSGIAAEAPHLTMTDHGYGVSVIVVQKKWWDAQTSATRELLSKAFPEARQTRSDVRAESLRDLEDAAQLGIQVHALTAEQREVWRAASAGVADIVVSETGGRSAEIMQVIRAAQQAYRTR